LISLTLSVSVTFGHLWFLVFVLVRRALSVLSTKGCCSLVHFETRVSWRDQKWMPNGDCCGKTVCGDSSLWATTTVKVGVAPYIWEYRQHCPRPEGRAVAGVSVGIIHRSLAHIIARQTDAGLPQVLVSFLSLYCMIASCSFELMGFRKLCSRRFGDNFRFLPLSDFVATQ